MNRLDKILARIETGLAFLAGGLLLFITFSICISIALRIMKIQTPLWAVQFNEYSLLWMTFLGSAWLLRKGRHVSLDILTNRVGTGGLKVLSVIHAVLGLGVCGVLAWISTTVTWDLFRRGVMDVRAVDVPKYSILAVVLVGFVVLTLEFVSQLVRAVATALERK